MAEISGENGAVYWNEELVDVATTSSLIFSTGKTITNDSTGSAGPFLNFVTEGYTAGMLVTVSGCSTGVAANNRIFTLTEVSSGELTVSEPVLAADPEAAAVTFTEAEPGAEILGFYSWTLSRTGDALETTNFDNSSGGRSYIPGLTGWTVTADKYFLTTGSEINDWVGETCEIRLFLNYVAQTTGAPSTGNISQYWKGDTVVTGIDETTPVDALVTQSISFQGDRTLTLKTQKKPWSSGIST